MPYFFVIPVFILAVVAMSGVVILCALVPRLRWAYPFAWRMLLWSSAGCLLANIPVFALYLVPFGLERSGVRLEASGNSALRVLLALGLLVGPLIASAAGYVGGAFLGLRLASRIVAGRNRDMRTSA